MRYCSEGAPHTAQHTSLKRERVCVRCDIQGVRTGVRLKLFRIYGEMKGVRRGVRAHPPFLSQGSFPLAACSYRTE